MLPGVSENFRNICLEIYELNIVKLSSVPGLVWQAALKKAKVKLYLLTDMDMLLMVQKCMRGGICYSIYQYGKTNDVIYLILGCK